MKGFGALGEHKHQIICIVGMAMVWPSLHNQLLYPLTFSFNKQVDFPLYPYYLLYSLVLLVVVALLLAPRKRDVVQGLLSSRYAMLGFGLAGFAGILILVTCDYDNALTRGLIGLGMALVGAFLPVHFMFWSAQITHASMKRAAFDLALSYLLFCAITLFRLALNLHAWPFSLCYPLLSGILGFVVLREPAKASFAFNRSKPSDLPLQWLVPSVALVYVATVSRLLMNPADAASNYPPQTRVFMYAALFAVCLVFAALYRPRSRSRRTADLPAFTVATTFMVACLVLSAFTTLTADTQIGSFPAIAGTNIMELFVWMLVLSHAQIRHTGIVGPAALYLVFLLGACHLASVLTSGGSGLFDLNAKDLPMLAINIALAILVVLLVNATMTALIANSAARPAAPQGTGGPASPSQGSAAPQDAAPAPACLTMAEDEEAILAIQQAFGLSRRETDTLRLAARSKTSKEIAEGLFVAESTVNSHIKSIYRKCDVHSRRDLIALVNHYKKGQR